MCVIYNATRQLNNTSLLASEIYELRITIQHLPPVSGLYLRADYNLYIYGGAGASSQEPEARKNVCSQSDGRAYLWDFSLVNTAVGKVNLGKWILENVRIRGHKCD